MRWDVIVPAHPSRVFAWLPGEFVRRAADNSPRPEAARPGMPMAPPASFDGLPCTLIQSALSWDSPDQPLPA
jgi:hypothetical protein